MINELYKLSEAMSRADIKAGSWHRKYKPLPNISERAPCLRITISGGRVVEISPIEKELGLLLRKYGTNQGTFPGMNLAPLYRVTDETIKKNILELRPEALNSIKIEEIRRWCIDNNWNDKFQNKYRISMKNVPEELSALVPEFAPLRMLFEESALFLDPTHMHRELENRAFAMLSERKGVKLALDILFYLGNPGKRAEDDSGSISVYLETPRLIETGIPAASHRFVTELNRALLSTEDARASGEAASDVDAFGNPFCPIDDPMPEVKLAGGFDVKLRTMFKEQRCQTRYGKIESESYPISAGMRKTLQSSLAWLGCAEQKGKTWLNTDKNEILFAYPSQLPKAPVSYVNSFVLTRGGGDSNAGADSESLFIACAKGLISELQRGKEVGTESAVNHLHIFILRKLDKARTKVVYTRQTDAREMEKLCEEWTVGCENLPHFPFGQPRIIFPLSAADVLNGFWRQDGKPAAPKFKPIPRYHGMELLLEPGMPIAPDLHILAEQTVMLEGFISGKFHREGLSDRTHLDITDLMNLLSLLGMLLYRVGIRKETYMESLPYLFGQLLKVSDELHALYCVVVRDGDLPAQLAGSGAYQSAVEAPVRTLNLLGTRMNPYITWAKTYRSKGIAEKGKESWRAAWLLSMYEGIASKLYEIWQPETRFGDAERAQLFIGYLAAFPKREHSAGQALDENGENIPEEIKEESKHV